MAIKGLKPKPDTPKPFSLHEPKGRINLGETKINDTVNETPERPGGYKLSWFKQVNRAKAPLPT